MKYFYINTDKSIMENPLGTCKLWFDRKLALTGDYPGAKWNHSKLFAKLEIGDVLFMYHSGTGFVGVGDVNEIWDKQAYTGSQRVLYHKQDFEYRIDVNWFRDWRAGPKSAHELELPVTPYYYCEIDPRYYKKVKKLVARLRRGK